MQDLLNNNENIFCNNMKMIDDPKTNIRVHRWLKYLHYKIERLFLIQVLYRQPWKQFYLSLDSTPRFK